MRAVAVCGRWGGASRTRGACAVATQPSEHAIAVAASHRRHCHPDPEESQRTKLPAMADDPATPKERGDPPKDGGPGDEEPPPPWAAAMARQIVEAVEKAGQAQARVSKGTSPGTSGESH